MVRQINFYRLVSGECYVIVKPFTDYYGNHFAAGEKLVFVQKHFLPYDGGHTLVFRERRMYLQEDEQGEIIENFNDYLAVASDERTKIAG